MKPQFDYATFMPHGIGFVTADEEARPCQSCVFVCRVGAVGGAVFMDLLPADVVRPDPRPESLNDPTLRKRAHAITEQDKRAAVLGGVMTHSSLRRCVDLQIATCMLTVCQTISNLLNKTTRMSCRDLFLNLYRRSLGRSSWIGWGRFNPKVHA